MRAAIYCRVSSEEQAQHGFSLAAQERDCRIHVEKISPGAIVEVYTDGGVSGETLHRPQMQRMREDVDGGRIDFVVTLDPDRLSRTLTDLLLVTDEMDCKCPMHLHFVNMEWQRTPEGRLFLSLRGAVAEFEKAKIRQRMLHGRRQKVRSGGIGVVPHWIYGYRYNSGTGSMEVEEQEAAVVCRLYEDYCNTGAGTCILASRLQAEGAPPTRGPRGSSGRWHQATVLRILSNPAYAGRLRQFAKSEDALYVPIPPIVSPQLWERAQRIRESNSKHSPGRGVGAAAAPLLSALLWCGKCGRRLHTSRSKRPYGIGVYAYYYCPARRNVGHGITLAGTCDLEPAGMRKLDEAVWARVSLRLSKPDAWWEACIEEYLHSRQSGQELERIAKRLEEVRRARKRVLGLVTRGELEEDEAADALGQTKQELGELAECHRVLVAKRADGRRMAGRIQELRARLDTPSPAERRMVLRELVDRIDVLPAEQRKERLRLHYRLPLPVEDAPMPAPDHI